MKSKNSFFNKDKKPFVWLKNKLKKISTLNLVLIIASAMLLLTSSVMFGYSFCSGGLVIASNKQFVNGYYLVEVDCVQDYEQAIELSSQIQNRGGAGYIRYDKGWHIFASGYCSNDDAKSVAEKLKPEYSNAKVYNLNIEDFDFNNGFSQNVNQIFKNNILSFKYAIENIDRVLIQYDNNEASILNVKNVAILNLEEIDKQIDKFLDTYTRDTTFIKYKSYILEFRDYINKITTVKAEDYEFSKLVQYQKISCMFSLQKILELI